MSRIRLIITTGRGLIMGPVCGWAVSGRKVEILATPHTLKP
jgi:hypothetical protein